MYTSFFGLEDTPFNLTPDPRYLYLSASHREALAQLIYGIREKKGFIVVTGEVGTGKTTLLHTLLEHFDPGVKVAFVFYPRLDFRDLLRLVLEDFGCQTVASTTSQYLLQLNQFLIERRRSGDTTVLIIDEAQHLSPMLLEDLRMLSNLEAAGEKLLQIVLVGQPELQETLQIPRLRQLRQRISLSCELLPLRAPDTYSYIHHRFAVAGGEARMVFTSRALKIIHTYTRGLPRQIHTVCDNALLAAYAEGVRSVTPRIVRQVIRDMRPTWGRKKLVKRRGMIIVLFVCVALLLGLVLFDAQADNSSFPSLSRVKNLLQYLFQELRIQESIFGVDQAFSDLTFEGTSQTCGKAFRVTFRE
jgi:type II secretory pathway predicted ATPase ExeA